MRLKNYFDFIFFWGLISNIKYSSYQKIIASHQQVFNIEDLQTAPQPLKGMANLLQDWHKELSSANLHRLNGTVVFNFIITETGEMENIQIEGGSGNASSKQLFEVFKTLQVKWRPGLINNKRVSVNYELILPKTP
jgi:hypothetical protein